MKRIISLICVIAMLTSLCPVFAASETVENFKDTFEGSTFETFLDKTAEGYVPQRHAVAAHSLNLESMGGTLGNAFHRAGGWYNESAYITYKVRPGSQMIVDVYDKVDDYDITFRYSTDGSTLGTTIGARKEATQDYTSSGGNVFPGVRYTVTLPQDANYFTVYLPDAATKDAPQTALYTNWMLGVVSVEMTDSVEESDAVDANIYWNDVHQLIEGFGAALNPDGTKHIQHHPEVLDFLYDEENGLGFSIVRLPVVTESRSDGDGPLKEQGQDIDFTKDATQVWALKKIKAVAPETTVMACSWSPMLYMKDNQATSGGHLLPEYYQEYAEFFADYIEGYEREHGIKIDILSPQNEPESAPGWSSCYWSDTNFRDFVKNNLQPEFEKRNIDTEIMIGDYANFRVPSTSDSLVYLEDEETRDDVDIVSAHSYWAICDRFDRVKELMKRCWETETSDTGTPDNPTIEYGIGWAEEVHALLTKSEVNAFCFWYLMHRYSNSEALVTCNDNDGYVINKRCWTFGNYSKVVRPGYYRIGMDESPVSDVFCTAFKDEETGKCAVVCINDGSETVDFNFKLNGFEAESVKGWRTSTDENMAELEAKEVNGSQVELTLDPKSVTSFVFEGCTSDIQIGTIEAETGSGKLGNGQNAYDRRFSGEYGVKYISAKDNGVYFDHVAAADSVSVRYASLGATAVSYNFYVNDEFVKTVEFPSTIAAGNATGDVLITADIPQNASIKLTAVQDSDGIFVDSVTLNPNSGSLNLMSVQANPNFDWAESYVTAASDAEVLNVSMDNAGDFITRAEFVKALVSLLDLKSEWAVNFFDASDKEDYYGAVGIARELGVIPENDENMFYPNEYLTREDMFIFTANALKAKGVADKGGAYTDFSDWELLSEEGKQAVSLLISNGIISGNGDKLNPHSYTYFAQTAVVFNMLMS